MFAWRSFPQDGPGPKRPGPGAFLTVPQLERRGIRVAFTTRHGGISPDPFSSLNLSYVSGDDPELVQGNRTRALGAVGGSLESWTGARQIHGNTVVRVGTAERGAGWSSPDDVIPDADALWTDSLDVSIAVLTADCVPIVLADPERRLAGVVHAGWRGLLSGVIDAAVGEIGGAERLIAYVGPSIGPCCYEVGPDVAGPARDLLGDVVREIDGQQRLDLWAGSLVALARSGVKQVWPAALCTRSESHRFFSNRAGSAARQGVVVRIAS
jgi:purine-nucleoside/S-methyl-5'-thioadenosine phosphorylase / adenosine deaminase